MQHNRPDYNQRIQDSAGLIPDDEPVFLLRGQDQCAVSVVRYWAFLARDQGVDPVTVSTALRQAEAMADWPVKKLPDNFCNQPIGAGSNPSVDDGTSSEPNMSPGSTAVKT